jgi:hypothetical protein
MQTQTHDFPGEGFSGAGHAFQNVIVGYEKFCVPPPSWL